MFFIFYCFFLCYKFSLSRAAKTIFSKRKWVFKIIFLHDPWCAETTSIHIFLGVVLFQHHFFQYFWKSITSSDLPPLRGPGWMLVYHNNWIYLQQWFRSRRFPVQRTVRPHSIVADSPLFYENLRFLKCIEYLSIQEFVSKSLRLHRSDVLYLLLPSPGSATPQPVLGWSRFLPVCIFSWPFEPSFQKLYRFNFPYYNVDHFLGGGPSRFSSL